MFYALTFSTTSDYSLRSLPSITSEFELKAESLSSQLTGDPSYFVGSSDLENADEEQAEEDPAAEDNYDKQKNQLPEKFREVHRLSYIVKVCNTF